MKLQASACDFAKSNTPAYYIYIYIYIYIIYIHIYIYNIQGIYIYTYIYTYIIYRVAYKNVPIFLW